MLRRRIEKKNEGVLGKDQFGFTRGKGTGDAIWMLKIIPEQTLDIDGEVCVCVCVCVCACVRARALHRLAERIWPN